MAFSAADQRLGSIPIPKAFRNSVPFLFRLKHSSSNRRFKRPSSAFLIREIHLSVQANVGAAVSVLLALIAKMYFAD